MINCFDKLSLITGCCSNKRKQRFVEQGDKKLDVELDLAHILLLMKKLEKLIHDPTIV